MTKKLNVGILGIGRISNKTYFSIKKNRNYYKILALCDNNNNKLNFNINALKFKSLNQMLNKKLKFNLISICTPSGLHKSHAIQCLKKGVNVLIEKPMALNRKDGNEIIKAGKKIQKIFVCLQNRYNPTIQLLKKAIDNNKFGKIYFVSVNVFGIGDKIIMIKINGEELKNSMVGH